MRTTCICAAGSVSGCHTIVMAAHSAWLTMVPTLNVTVTCMPVAAIVGLLGRTDV